jgi:hypothetical protein
METHIDSGKPKIPLLGDIRGWEVSRKRETLGGKDGANWSIISACTLEMKRYVVTRKFPMCVIKISVTTSHKPKRHHMLHASNE